MYVIISFDIITSNQNDKAILISDIKSILKRYYWVKPISNLFIIKVDDEGSGNYVRKSFLDIAKKNTSKMRIIISPVYEGGSFMGLLPKELWPTIKSLTKQEENTDFEPPF